MLATACADLLVFVQALKVASLILYKVTQPHTDKATRVINVKMSDRLNRQRWALIIKRMRMVPIGATSAAIRAARSNRVSPIHMTSSCYPSTETS